MSDFEISDQELWRRFNQGSQRAASCPDFNQLAAYTEDRLQGTELELVERHLAGCKLCLDAVRADISISAATRPIVLPRRSSGRVALTWAGMAAACALVCLAGFEMGQGTARMPRASAVAAMDFSPVGAGE